MHIPYKNKCACGSNKLYIDCCLIKNQSWSEVMERQKIAASLRWKVIDFASSSLSTETQEALSMFFQGTYLKAAEIPDEKMGPFLDWYIHDYILPSTNTSVLEHFFEERSKLFDMERFLTSGWLGSYNSCYHVKEIKPGFWILIEDIITRKQYLVANPELSEMTPPWSIFVGRLVPLGGLFEFDFIHHTLPPTALPLLIDILMEAYGSSNEKSNLRYPTFLKEVLSASLPRLITEKIKTGDLSPASALSDHLLPYSDLFDWIFGSFYQGTLATKPGTINSLLTRALEQNILKNIFDIWPEDLSADTSELGIYLTWLEFFDACLVIHFGKNPPYNFNEKAQELGLKRLNQATFKPLHVTRTKIVQEGKAFEKVSKVLLKHMSRGYNDKEIQAAILLWQHYLGQTEDVPNIKNPKIWAAAVEYCLSNIRGIPTTQNTLAEAYKVSVSSISRVFNVIKRNIDYTSLSNDILLT